MLSEQEITEIREEMARMPTNQSACVGALKTVQKHRGYVSDESIADLAALLEMTPSELDAVATFYNLIFRRPVGKHVILLCDSVSCWIMGEETIFGYLQKKLGIDWGGTTTDGQFTLLPAPCLGHCEQAPAMALDNKIIGNLTPEKIDTVLSEAMVKES